MLLIFLCQCLIAGSDLAVSLVLIGRHGQAGPLTITQEPGAAAATAAAGRTTREVPLQACQCDKFTLHASQELGDLQQAKVSLLDCMLLVMISTPGPRK